VKLTPKWLTDDRERRNSPPLLLSPAEREQLPNLAHEAARETDRTLVTVCSAILAVSVPFTQQYIVGNPAASWIVVSWILYAFCLVVLILSLRYDLKQKYRLIEKSDHHDSVVLTYSLLIRLTNWLSQTAFLAATASLVVFLVLTAMGAKK
jgi:hypothetical protein